MTILFAAQRLARSRGPSVIASPAGAKQSHPLGREIATAALRLRSALRLPYGTLRSRSGPSLRVHRPGRLAPLSRPPPPPFGPPAWGGPAPRGRTAGGPGLSRKDTGTVRGPNGPSVCA